MNKPTAGIGLRDWFDQNLSAKDQLDQSRCAHLFSKAGLSSVTKLVRIWSSKDEHGYSYSRADESYVILSMAEIDRTLAELNEETSVDEIEVFTAVVMHEIGHVVAYDRHVDCTDEKIAWSIAEELLPIPKPKNWDRIKQLALNTYAWQVRATRLDPSQLRKYRVPAPILETACPICSSRVARADRIYTSMISDRTLVCQRCRAVYNVRTNGPDTEYIAKYADEDAVLFLVADEVVHEHGQA